jgi:hypothetical protein
MPTDEGHGTVPLDATRWSPGGWKTIAGAVPILAGAPLSIIVASGTSRVSILAAVRMTAIVGFLAFMLPFTASAAAAFYPGEITRWVKAHRRYFGIVFALAMAVHLMFVAWLFRISPKAPAGLPVFVLGGLGYLFVAALFLTSFDGPADRLGPYRWRRLHVAGVWYLWSIFVLVMALSLALAPMTYGPLLAIAFAAAALRWALRRRRLALRSAAANA